MVDTVSAAQARRIALAAQGFGRALPELAGIRQLNSAIERLGVLQLDSVNVFERSHYIPLFSRLGSYDRGHLDRLAFVKKGRYIEYWAHQAAIIPVESWPLFRWRMEDYRTQYSNRENGWVQSNRPMLEWLLAELAEKGPLPASKVEHEANKRTGPWWGHSLVKEGLEYLFLFGDVVTAGRTRFERTYALPQTILPARVLDTEIPRDDAIRQLVSVSAKALGIGTLRDLADYFRLSQEQAKTAVQQLVDAGELLPVTVAGWNRPAWLHRDARIPRRIEATALLSPFDPIVWERDRALRMFGFHYRIEIYTPAPKRIFGYYTLPLLIDEQLVGRVDLKSDRQNRVLRVQAAWREPDAPPETAARLATLLRQTALWQGLDGVEVVGRGDLAAQLAAALGTTPIGFVA